MKNNTSIQANLQKNYIKTSTEFDLNIISYFKSIVYILDQTSLLFFKLLFNARYSQTRANENLSIKTAFA